MSDTEQRTLSGAAIGTAGGAAVGAITGEWAWAAAGAAAGAAGGYLYDKQKKKEQAAYEEGVKAGKQQAQ
jgi:outer membrane lipoprotein SlyB